MHFGFYAASAVVSAPASPQGTAQISLYIDRIVTSNCSGARWFPGLCIFTRVWGVLELIQWINSAPDGRSPGGDHRIGVSGGNRLVAFALVIRPVCGDAADVLIRRDLVQEFGQHGSITNVAAGDFDRPHFKRYLIDTNVYLTPNAVFGAAVLACVPLAFTFGIDACAVHCPAVET